MGAYIGYVKKNGVVKSVEYLSDGSIDELGVNLHVYFKDLADVKSLLTSTIDFIDEDAFEFADSGDTESEGDFEEYEDEEDWINSMDALSHYYLFKEDEWFVSKPNWCEFKELEVILEEEY